MKERFGKLVGVLLSLIMLLLTSGCQQAKTTAPHSEWRLVQSGFHYLVFPSDDGDLVPFDPIVVHAGETPQTLLGLAYVPGNDFYLSSYDAADFTFITVANGLNQVDPLWGCDNAFEREVSIAPSATWLARSCNDGSLTIYHEPETLAAYHQPSVNQPSFLTDRSPVIEFAIKAPLVAITDDGPTGPGHLITIRQISTWLPSLTLHIAEGLLTRPAFSPDGTTLAAIDLAGTLHIWQTATGMEQTVPIAGVNVPHAEAMPALPAPQWTSDGQHVVVAVPTGTGMKVIMWEKHGAKFQLHAYGDLAGDATLAPLQIAPDNTLVLVRTAMTQATLLAMADLHQAATVALPGNLTLWEPDARHLLVFGKASAVIELALQPIEPTG